MLPPEFRRIRRSRIRNLSCIVWRYQKVENGLWLKSHCAKLKCVHVGLCLFVRWNQIIRKFNVILRLPKKYKSESRSLPIYKSCMITKIWKKLLKTFLAAYFKRNSTVTQKSPETPCRSKSNLKETDFRLDR